VQLSDRNRTKQAAWLSSSLEHDHDTWYLQIVRSFPPAGNDSNVSLQEAELSSATGLEEDDDDEVMIKGFSTF
jgi:hypothetical protein